MNLKRITLVLALALACVSCNKSSSSGSAPGFTTAAVASHDYTKPYLTDEKIQKFLQSMSEAQNPFEGMFAHGGRTPADLPREVAALDAFARKYGFSGYQDYIAVWGRIAVGEAIIMSEGMKKSVREMTEKNIQNAQEQLKNPNLSPEMRKAYEEQVTSGQQSLKDLDKPSDTKFNDSDLALVRKYSSQIQDASKKYRRQGIPTQ